MRQGGSYCPQAHYTPAIWRRITNDIDIDIGRLDFKILGTHPDIEDLLFMIVGNMNTIPHRTCKEGGHPGPNSKKLRLT